MNLTEQFPPTVSVQIDGRPYRLTTLTLRDHAEAAGKIELSLESPGAAALRVLREADADEKQAQQLLAIAYRDYRGGNQVTLKDVLAWYETPRGESFRNWLRFRRYHPELTEADVDRLLTSMRDEEVEAFAMADATADGMPVGNFRSRLRRMARRITRTTASLGAKFRSRWRKKTAGPKPTSER